MRRRVWLCAIAGFVLFSTNVLSQSVILKDAFPRLIFRRPLFLTHSGDQSNRLFVVRQGGFIHVLRNDSTIASAPVFLDVSTKLSSAVYEEGLLGLAFPPDFRTSRAFYISYTAPSSDSSGGTKLVVARYAVSSDDSNRAEPTSERRVLEIEKPYVSHNGGMIAFGPDSTLYVGVGDGGSHNDSLNNGQSLTTLLGKILRIDVRGDSGYTIPPDNPFAGNTAGIREEIWAYGFRNPWRFSIDPPTGQLWAGDVGQETREEVDIVIPGGNYGWNIIEGDSCGPGAGACDTTGLVMPVKAYGRNVGYSVTGGYVYRGSLLPHLRGGYIFADYGSGRIFLLRYENGVLTTDSLLFFTNLHIASFGMDERNELYAVAHNTGKIMKFTGNVGSSSVETAGVPAFSALEQNYPNPFNPLTIIKYTVAGARDQGPGVSVKLTVYDLLGREVAVLVNERKPAGAYEVSFDGSGLASGVYVYRLTAGTFVRSRTMVLIR